MLENKYKKKYLKYKKKYLKLKKIIGGVINIEAKEFIPKKKKMNVEAKEFVPKKKKIKTDDKKELNIGAKEFIPKNKQIEMIEKRELKLVTHNLGGQTYYINKNDKSYLSCERGEIVPEKTKKKYKTIEELSENISPPELNEDIDIYLFQEWQTQEISGTRINDLVIQTKWDKTIYGKNRYLDYSDLYLIDKIKKENEKIIIRNVHLPIVSETSSLSQIEKLIKILEEMVLEFKSNKKIIMGGDFNIDFNNKDYENIKEILDNSKKKGVKENSEKLMKSLRILYSEFNSENLIMFPIEKEIKTNIWSLREDGKLIEKCVDYIMISKNLEENIDIRKSEFEIDESYVGGSKGEEIKFLRNDYDHKRLKLKIVLNERYRVGYINE